MGTDNKLLTAHQKAITKDWQLELPKLGIYENRELLRRVGPLLVGVHLARDSAGDNYLPIFHVHFLGNSCTFLSLTLGQEVKTDRGSNDKIKVRQHEERYKDSVRRLKEQASLSVEGPLTLREVIEAYRNFMKTPLGLRQPGILFDDCIRLMVSQGFPEEAHQMLREVLELVPDDRWNDFQNWGGRESFEKETLDIIDHPQKVWDHVEQSLKALKVPRRVPVEDFVKD